MRLNFIIKTIAMIFPSKNKKMKSKFLSYPSVTVMKFFKTNKNAINK